MTRLLLHPAGRCRHEKYGRCTNEFWEIMKTEGKPGLRDYLCLHWRAKLEVMQAYQEAGWQADRLGLTGEDRRRAIDRFLAGTPAPAPICPDFRPRADGPLNECRYFFLEACVLRFQSCPGDCPNYLPPGDQRG